MSPQGRCRVAAMRGCCHASEPTLPVDGIKHGREMGRGDLGTVCRGHHQEVSCRQMSRGTNVVGIVAEAMSREWPVIVVPVCCHASVIRVAVHPFRGTVVTPDRRPQRDTRTTESR